MLLDADICINFFRQESRETRRNKENRKKFCCYKNPILYPTKDPLKTKQKSDCSSDSENDDDGFLYDILQIPLRRPNASAGRPWMAQVDETFDVSITDLFGENDPCMAGDTRDRRAGRFHWTVGSPDVLHIDHAQIIFT